MMKGVARKRALERSRQMTRRVLVMMVVGCALVAPSFARAQAQDNTNNNNQNRRGNFDPAQMRERFMNSIKEQLKADDDEWKVLSPKIEKLMTAQRDARAGGGAFGRRPGGGGGGGGADNQPTTAVAKASADLRTALDNKDTPAEDIAKKLAALREARDKARADLAAVQKELKEVLTQRQEAVLVTMGMLE
jgi:peptidoglycan hydrolase CwlO-like protein